MYENLLVEGTMRSIRILWKVIVVWGKLSVVIELENAHVVCDLFLSVLLRLLSVPFRVSRSLTERVDNEMKAVSGVNSIGLGPKA